MRTASGKETTSVGLLVDIQGVKVTLFGRSEIGLQPPRRVNGLRDSHLGEVVHHTAGPEPRDLDHAFGLCRGIQQLHFSKGWNDAAYNCACADVPGVGPSIFELRGVGIQPGATAGINYATHAYVTLSGHPPGNNPSGNVQAALWGAQEFVRGGGFNVDPASPHSQHASTFCPGDGNRNLISSGTIPKPGIVAPPPPPPTPAPGPLDDHRTFWRPPQTRALKKGDQGADVAEFQLLGNLTVADPFTPNASRFWVPVDGDYGPKTEKMCGLVQFFGNILGLYNGGLTGIADQDVGHVVVATMNSKGYW